MQPQVVEGVVSTPVWGKIFEAAKWQLVDMLAGCGISQQA